MTRELVQTDVNSRQEWLGRDGHGARVEYISHRHAWMPQAKRASEAQVVGAICTDGAQARGRADGEERAGSECMAHSVNAEGVDGANDGPSPVLGRGCKDPHRNWKPDGAGGAFKFSNGTEQAAHDQLRT